jgi:O-antigen/teichoic acid export membrane protein
MMMKKDVIINVASLLCGVVAAIVTAALGLGYWALIINMIVTNLVSTILLWLMTGWLPSLPSRRYDVSRFLRFGGVLTVGRIVNYLVRRVDDILLGAVSGPASLAYYQKAYKLLLIPLSQVNIPATSVAIPAFSRLQDRPQVYRKYYIKGMRIITALTMPIVIFCLVNTDTIIHILLGQNWTEVVPIFRALGPAAFLGTMNIAAGWVLVPLGLGKRRLKISVYGAVLVLAAFIIGVNWGALGLAIAFSIAEVVKRGPQLHYAFKGTPISLRDLGHAIYMPCISSLLSGIACMMIRNTVAYDIPRYSELALQVLLYAILYIIIWIALPRGRSQFMDIIRSIVVSIRAISHKSNLKSIDP